LTAPRSGETMFNMRMTEAADAGLAAVRILMLAALLSATIALTATVRAAQGASAADREAWVVEGSAGLEPRAIDALARMIGADRRLLALRAYLRAGDSLPERWSWSQEQLAAYPSTPEGKAAAADIDTVAATFAAANPGFTLRVNRQPRSLELQIARWNENESVGSVAAELVAWLAERLKDDPATPNADRVRNALMDWKPAIAATLAAPGLSAHGQGRAFDFQIEHGGQVIAGVEAASARQQWDEAGWTQKLQAAVTASGRRFVGPLQSPYEPWHYAYTPTRTPTPMP